jgi:LynF/TruF/PatF family peptide O-prenyltransferase
LDIPKDEQVEKFRKHKEIFGIVDDVYLGYFERLLKQSDKFVLECSCKVEGEGIFPTRFNIWYEDKFDIVGNMNLILGFLNSLVNEGCNLDYSSFKEVLGQDFDIDRIEEVVVGIDLRKNVKESRAKVWFVSRDYPEIENKLFEIKDYRDSFPLVSTSKYFLFGFDFYFDGRKSVKIYPRFGKSFLQDPEKKKMIGCVFSDRISDLIFRCRSFNVSFKDTDLKRTLHFHPQNNKEFIDKIGSEKLSGISERLNLKDAGKIVVSLIEEEIDKNAISNFNIYY